MTMKDITNEVGNVNPAATREEEDTFTEDSDDDSPPALVDRVARNVVVVNAAVMTPEERDVLWEDPTADFPPFLVPRVFPRARPTLAVVAPAPPAASPNVAAAILAAHILSYMGSDGEPTDANRVTATSVAAHIVSYMDTVDE